jgi:hypothetical protein
MPDVPDQDHDVEHVERIAADAEVLKNAWQETIDEMKAMAADLEDDGWETHYVAAGDTAPEPPEGGEEGRWGIVHVIPDNYADEVEAFVERGDFPKYDVFRTEMQGRVFLLTVLYDPEESLALLVAGQFELWRAGPLVSTAKEEGAMYTHVQTLDGTLRGAFEHEEPSKFFPYYEQFEDRFSSELAGL